MAKKTVTKKKMIEDYINENPEAKSSEIAAALKKHGITLQAVYNYKSYAKKLKASKRSSGPKKNGSARALPVKRGTNGKAVDWDAVKTGLAACRKFIEEVGDVETAKEVLTLVSSD